MKNIIFILITSCYLISCKSQGDKKVITINSSDNSSIDFPDKKKERFFPAQKTTEKFDTIIADRQIHISIKKTNLDSYVVNEYEESGSKQIDKYRDFEIELTIKDSSQILLDTIFRKEQFLKYADKEFIDIAIFHNYWFNNISKDKIEFLGVISKPETDWTISFYHYFDLTSRTLKFVELSDDDDE